MIAFDAHGFSAGVIVGSRKDAPSSPDTTISGNVISVFGEVKSPWAGLEEFSLVARWDRLEPDQGLNGDKTTLIICGIAYKPNTKLTFTIDYQAIYGELSSTLKKTAGGTSGYDGRLFLHMATVF